MARKQRSGKEGRVTVGAANLVLKEWHTSWKGEDLDTVNFESFDEATGQSFDEGIIGVESVDFGFKGDWDASFNPLDDPPGLFPREDLDDVSLFTSVLDDVSWDFPVARVLQADNASQVRGQPVSFSASCKNQGTFSPPTGSAA